MALVVKRPKHFGDSIRESSSWNQRSYVSKDAKPEKTWCFSHQLVVPRENCMMLCCTRRAWWSWAEKSSILSSLNCWRCSKSCDKIAPTFGSHDKLMHPKLCSSLACYATTCSYISSLDKRMHSKPCQHLNHSWI